VSDYSLAILVGRLTRDPELKYTNPGGIPYVKMSLAINREQKVADGTVKKTVSFVDITVWRHLAEICAQFLKKGRTVMVVGSIRQSRWTAKDGTPRSRIEVNAERVQFLNRPDAALAVAVAPNGQHPEEAEPDGEESGDAEEA
jgi:single-strand DNA-binding protein